MVANKYGWSRVTREYPQREYGFTQQDAALLSTISSQYDSSWCHGVIVLVWGACKNRNTESIP